MLTKNEYLLLKLLKDRYKWVWKTHNCAMVSMEEPEKEGSCYNAPDRIELGGFKVKFDSLESNTKPVRISQLMGKRRYEEFFSPELAFRDTKTVTMDFL